MSPAIIDLFYLVASGLFIIGLKGLTHPRTAVRGNALGAAGMLLAVVVTLFDHGIVSFTVIFAGLVVGTAIGLLLCAKIEMTKMPEMVAILNGFGGAGSTLVAGAALIESTAPGVHYDTQAIVAVALSGIIGTVTFWGSLVAFGKLQGIVRGNAVVFPGQHALNAALGIATLACTAWLVMNPRSLATYWVLVVIATLLGVLLVIPIGGADMPVVISLLNSYSGLAAAATGFVLSNTMLIIAGSLVGASGVILTQIMCKAMNRSITNVLFGGFGAQPTAGAGAGVEVDIYAGRVKSTTGEEVAMLLEGARRVVIVPGYGMAVAQAQHAVRTLANLLEANGTVVEYGIHPVAGRMPGHMNVLLAEANIPYDKLKDMETINPTFEQTDVVIVIGANDVVNPLARTDPSSPIAGMPILDVDKARVVINIKRSLSPGFAGIANPLFAADNSLMFYADARQAVQEITAALKEALAA